MTLRRSHLVGVVLVAASALASVLAYPEMPAEMVIHWNPSGRADDTTARLAALALFPALSAGVLGLFAVLPRIDPLGENVAGFRTQFDRFVVVLLAFLLYVHLLVLAWNAGHEFATMQALAPALGVLFYYAGGLVEHAEQNWFFGIRTPWTLADEEVWRATHERVAPLFKRSAVVVAAGVLVPEYATYVVIAPAVAVSLYATVYSYVEYRRTAT